MKFLNMSILCAVSLMLFANCTAEKGVGLQLYSLRADMSADPVATVQKVGAMGYDFVETAGYSDGKFYGYEPKEFKKILNDSGLEFLGSHMGSPAPDRAKWDELMAYWDIAIEAHAEAGVEYLVQPSMHKMAYESLAGLKLYCEYFNEIGAKCNAKGIRFGYHNHAKEFTKLEGEIIYDFMLNNTEPENVMFQLDLYWIAKGGKKATDYFEEYPRRFVSWHLKDEKELGASGDMDYESSYKMSKKAGLIYQVVEVERYNFTPLESVEKSLDFVKNATYIK